MFFYNVAPVLGSLEPEDGDPHAVFADELRGRGFYSFYIPLPGQADRTSEGKGQTQAVVVEFFW